ncbi:acyl-CoA thioesterase [Rhodovibrionaceae bacterium A322]
MSETVSSEAQPESRSAYPHFLKIPTRWNDNDTYAHVNNAVYYYYFDTVINEFLINHGGLDIYKGEVIGITPETFCRFMDSFAFPEIVDAGLRVVRLGKSSVKYQVALYKEGAEKPAALGHFVHVFVTRESMTPSEVPASLRQALSGLMAAD